MEAATIHRNKFCFECNNAIAIGADFRITQPVTSVAFTANATFIPPAAS